VRKGGGGSCGITKLKVVGGGEGGGVGGRKHGQGGGRDRGRGGRERRVGVRGNWGWRRNRTRENREN